jgi:NADPH:quinone reductase-like Zn-dependent oxidoreductase
VTSGVLRPRVAARLPLEQASQAHRLLQDRTTTGKILLTT